VRSVASGSLVVAMTTATWRFDGKALAWQWQRAHAEPNGRDLPTFAPRAGTLTDATATAFVAAQLAALRDAGVFALPDPVLVRQPEGAVMAWREHDVEVELAGAAGVFRYVRRVGRFAQFDPQLQRAEQALADAIAAVGELPTK
jgi:hypothetical protein